MQPYFFPYIGYFQLINAVDKWIVFDEIQYIRHGWVNRNRILHPNPSKKWMYISVFLENHSQNDKISEIKMSETEDWRSSILGKITHYKNKAPYYNQVRKFLLDCFSYKGEFLSKFNVFCLKKVCNYLDIDFDYQIFSEMDLKLDSIKEPGDWALEISKKLNVDMYINPIGGKDIFDRKKFKNASIELKFLESDAIKYKQSRENFVPNLSIIDVMMFNSKEKINEMLNNYQLL
jgi:hypothetical protein